MLVNYEKQNGVYKQYSQLPLTARPLDLLYFLFFVVHLTATLIVDLQYLYPPSWIPGFMRNLLSFYINMSKDPLMGGVTGLLGDSTHLMWFKTFIMLEVFFQVPVFILGLRGLYRGSRSIYPLFLLYGASAATATLACVTTVIQMPSVRYIPGSNIPILENSVGALTYEQRFMLLSSYVPFFLVPLIMAVDMALRVGKLVQKAVKVEEEDKWK